MPPWFHAHPLGPACLRVALAAKKSHVNTSDIYVHDGRLLRVIEEAQRGTLTMEVELPVSPHSDELAPRVIVFDDVHSYQVFEGPFQGCPSILDMQVVGEQGRWQRIRLETNAGYRELFCTGVRVLHHDTSS